MFFENYSTTYSEKKIFTLSSKMSYIWLQFNLLSYRKNGPFLVAMLLINWLDNTVMNIASSINSKPGSIQNINYIQSHCNNIGRNRKPRRVQKGRGEGEGGECPLISPFDLLFFFKKGSDGAYFILLVLPLYKNLNAESNDTAFSDRTKKLFFP